ncbi:dienelactone hydrolase family protein [Arthrobacter ginkgonis]|uniref:Dienelactone hydrolase family protein n=1 Tax=Arthrobacter ginkgonis TaxID=1630594 RepID=A0ABP7CCM0_9MICC
MIKNRHLDRPMTTWGSSAGTARAAVLAVHGRGQGPKFMQEQAGRLAVAGLRFYAPSAAGDTWYPKPFLEPLENNQPDLAHALEALVAHVAVLEADGFSPDRVVLWGFSQGACLVSHFVLTNPAKYAGLILHTGGYIGPDPLQVPPGRPLEGVPAVLRSIENDPWVPGPRIQQTASALEAAGARADLLIAPGHEHIITDEAMSAASGLLNNMLLNNSGVQAWRNA